MNITNMNYKILQTLLVWFFQLQTARPVPELVQGEMGEALGGPDQIKPFPCLFCLTNFNIYFEKIIGVCGGGGSPWSLLVPPFYNVHFIHYKITIPHYTNSLGSQQRVNNVGSMVREKEQKLYFGCVKCMQQSFLQFYLSEVLSCCSLCHIVEE